MRSRVFQSLCSTAFLAAALCYTAGAAGAAPVNYSEAVSGDLSTSSPLTTFTLDIGDNTVSGNLSSLDADAFAFVVPANTELAAGQVQLTDAAGDITSAHWELRSGAIYLALGTQIEDLGFIPSPGTEIIDAVPLGPGTYSLQHTGGSQAVSGSTADYTVTLTLRSTTAVPEPGSVLLLGLGAIGLSVARRLTRRR